MADYLKHKKVVIAADDVAQALGDTYEEVQDMNIHSKSNNTEVAYFGASIVKRSGVDEAGTPLNPSGNLPFYYGELSRLFVIGKLGDIFLLSYIAKENH